VRHKLVIIGAGSAMFTQGIVLEWLRRKPEGDWEIALVDIDARILEATEKMVRRFVLSAGNPLKISASTDRRDVLAGATVVLCTIGVGGRRAWEQDVFVPRKYGIFQPVGDSVMPGGVSRAMRMIPAVVDIAKDVERLCPQARFINYANPMTAIVRALRRGTSLPVAGLCIGVDETLHFLATLAEVPYDRLTAKWVGLNHLTWIWEIRDRGDDLWPVLRKRVAEQRAKGVNWELVGRMGWAEGDPNPAPTFYEAQFSWELFEEFGAFPAPMDRHVTEFFPARFPQGRYYDRQLGIDAFAFDKTIAYGDKIYDATVSLGKGEGPLTREQLETTAGEHMQLMDILESIQYDRREWYSVNLPNGSAVSNLPKDAILELPAAAGADGFMPMPIGELPAGVAAIMLRRLAAVEATVEAALTGNHKLMAEALVLDGGVSDYGVAERLSEDLLRAQADYLPQFK
jgi:alpha-galactosidase